VSDPTSGEGAPRTVRFGPFLTVAIAEATFAVALACTAVIAVLGQDESTERLIFLLGLLVAGPAALRIAWLRCSSRPEGEAVLGALGLLALIALELCAVKALAPSRVSLSLALALIVGRVCLALAGRAGIVARAPRLGAAQTATAVAVLVLVAIAPFAPSGAVTPGTIVPAIALAVAIGAALWSPWTAQTELGRAIDVLVVLVLLALVAYVGPLTDRLVLNQNYFLAPVDGVLHGQAMLVGTVSQYGVGLFDALALFFSVVPIGYGTFTLLLAALTVGLFVLVYAVLRLSIRSQALAVLGVLSVAVLDVYGQFGSYADYPSTGVLRFGLPWLVIALSVGATRSRRATFLERLVVIVVGVAAIWSGEAGVYCLGAAIAVAAIDAALGPDSRRVRTRAFIRRTVTLVAGAATGILLFTLLTRAFAGAWPDWGAYLNYIHLYTLAGFGLLPISAWSPGIALGAFYVVSASVIGVAAIGYPSFAREHRPAFVAAAGLTAMGALVFTYFLGRAAPNNLFHVAPPAVVLLFVWGGIARDAFGRSPKAAAPVGVTVLLAALMLAGERANFSAKYPSSPAGALLGQARSLPAELRSLAENPVFDGEAPHVETFIRALRRPRSPIVVLLFPSLESEVLLRLDRANAAGSSNPCQQSLSRLGAEQTAGQVRTLRPGTVVVTVLAGAPGGDLLPIGRYTLSLIRTRFALRRIGEDRHGLVAYEIGQRPPGTSQPTPRPPATIQTVAGCA
jgi:hypothetical protein